MSNSYLVTAVGEVVCRFLLFKFRGAHSLCKNIHRVLERTADGHEVGTGSATSARPVKYANRSPSMM